MNLIEVDGAGEGLSCPRGSGPKVQMRPPSGAQSRAERTMMGGRGGALDPAYHNCRLK